MAAGSSETGSGGHTPVLYQAVLTWLAPRSGRKYLDGTVGGGGHAEGILRSGAVLLGLDRDGDALRAARRRLGPYAERAILRQESFRCAPRILNEIGWGTVAGILLDLGLSSLQLADPQRGFSFRQDGPLDMRFDRSGGETAADLLDSLFEEELADILYKYGEERKARRIAKAIVRNRPLQNTRQLADVVAAAVGPSRGGSRMHPATRTFQALRIAVNRELEELEDGLPQLMDCLEEGGRLAVISFHSLEDRIVKRAFRRASGKSVRGEERLPGRISKPRFRELTEKPVPPDARELASNPRARSAKLRVLEKIPSSVLAGSTVRRAESPEGRHHAD
jgi:16S rRNA (cytosine1402-N4)-methyltransferase